MALTMNTRAWRTAAPGIVLSVGLALIAKFASSEISTSLMNGRASPLSPVLLGIVLGMLWRHFVGVGVRTEQGVQWILGTLLKVGIALVGLRLTLRGLTDVGLMALPIVVTCIATALILSNVVGRMLGLSATMRQLLAVGTAVCGCTAIVATAPAIRARPREISIAMACVVLIGSLGMLLLPWLAGAVFQSQALPVGVFLGSAIHDTSQVIGASLIAAQQFGSQEVIATASATKLLRNLSIAVLVPALAWLARSQPAEAGDESGTSQRVQAIPAFIIWFVALVFVRALGDQLFGVTPAAEQVWLQTMATTQMLSETLMLWGMTALGLSVSLSRMHDAGLRPLCAALIVALATAVCSLGLTYFLFQAWG
jgi:uncharacterized integral membrane protein (TIGR00698 family)